MELLGFERGLSHREVFDIQQDSLGYLWFGTINGLNRYDGYRFRRMPSDTIVDPIHFVLPRGEQRLQLGMAATLGECQHEEFFRSPIPGALSEPFGGMIADRWDNLWFLYRDAATGHDRLGLLPPGDSLRVAHEFSEHRDHRGLAEFGGLLHVGGANNQLLLFDLEGRQLQEEDLYNFGYRGNDPASAMVLDLQVSPDRTQLYALLKDGTIRVKQSRQKDFRTHSFSDKISAADSLNLLLPLPSGGLYLAGINTLFAIGPDGELDDLFPEANALSRFAPTFRSFFRDRSGVVWIATNFGALKITRERRLFTTYLEGGDNSCREGFCSMRGITSAPDGTIYASYYDNIQRIDPETRASAPLFPKDVELQPFGLLYHNDHLYTGNGLRIDPETRSIDTILPAPLPEEGVLTPIDDRTILFGVEDRLYRYSTTTGSLEPLSYLDQQLRGFRITSLGYDTTTNLLRVGTIELGLFFLDLTTGSIELRNTGNGMLHNRILADTQAPDGTIWVATAGGLNRISADRTEIRGYTMDNGLPNNFINGVLPEGDSAVWVSTDNGLSRFDRISKEFQNFYEKDGISANEFNRISFHRDEAGRFVFGGINGLLAFFPQQVTQRLRDRKPFPLLFTSFEKYDGETDSLLRFYSGLENMEELHISHKDRLFSFSYSVADFTNPRSNLYTHRMEGHEPKWSTPTADPTAHYSNLKPGSYTFRVRASPGGEYWNEGELSIPVRVDQVFWKTRRFITAAALFLIGLVYLVMQWRVKTLRRQERKLEELVRERTRELEQSKEQSDKLLLNILPAGIAEELKLEGKVRARRHEYVTVLFSDFVGFSKVAGRLSPEALVARIDLYFRGFDAIMAEYRLEKIKTIGDAYMCTAGMFRDDPEAPHRMVRAALSLQKFVDEKRLQLGADAFEVRIGIHTGPVVAGVVGTQKFAYDIWGDTVNLAARMEQYGETGRVNISQTTYELVRDRFECSPRGDIEVKNLGRIDMWLVEGALPEEEDAPSSQEDS